MVTGQLINKCRLSLMSTFTLIGKVEGYIKVGRLKIPEYPDKYNIDVLLSTIRLHQGKYMGLLLNSSSLYS